MTRSLRAGGKCCFYWTERGLLWLQKEMTCDPELRSTPEKFTSCFIYFFLIFWTFCFFQSHPADDYGTLVMAEALLEECLQENMDLLRSSTPLMDRNQPKLCRAKSHLNTILSRGRLTVSQAINSSCSCRSLSLKLVSFILTQVRVVLSPLRHGTLSIQIFSFMFC